MTIERNNQFGVACFCRLNYDAPGKRFVQRRDMRYTAAYVLGLLLIFSSNAMSSSISCTVGFDPKPVALNVSTLVFGDQTNFIYDVVEDDSQENIVYIAGNMVKLASRAHRNTSILAGSPTAGDEDGVGENARFSLPNGGLALSSDGASVVVADSGNNKIKIITVRTGEVVTLAGSGVRGFQDGVGSAAQFATPSSVALTPDGAAVVVADRINHLIRLVSLADGTTSTLAGMPGGEAGYVNGRGMAAMFNLPDGVAVTPNGQDVVVADSGNHRLRALSLVTGEARLLAGSGAEGFADGGGDVAMFNSPSGVAVTASGLYVAVADRRNDRVRLVRLADGMSSTLAGAGPRGSLDGAAGRARFNSPYAVHWQTAGEGPGLLVADFGNSRVRLVRVDDESLDECTCSPGHRGQIDQGGCTPCAEGSYKDFAGPGQCTVCPSGANFSAAGSVSVSNCSCLPGAFLAAPLKCIPCPPASFKPTPGPGPCTPCPDHSLSPNGSASSASCSCSPGYAGPDGGPCTACGAGGYKNESGPGPCAACPPGATSPPASAALAACQCAPGFELSGEPARCRPCPAGAFKPDAGPAPCQLCPVSRGHSAPGSTSLDNCTCARGYQGDGLACTPCLEGFYKDYTGAGGCTRCAANTSSLNASESRSECVCGAGLTGGPGGECVACGAGTFKGALGNGSCSPCPFNSNSSAGTTSPAGCLCDAGYHRGQSGACLACSRGRQKPAAGDHACTFCPQNTYKDTLGPGGCTPCAVDGSRVSATGSVSFDNCTCNAGFEPAGGVCRPCPSGQYKPAPGPAPCSLCADPNAVSVNGSTDAAACQCIPGFERDLDGVCSRCLAGWYKAEAGPGPCSPCPQFASAPAGSVSPAACTCLPGHVTAGEGGTCEACPPDSFHLQPDARCAPCPNGSTAPPASPSVAACQCRPGFSGRLNASGDCAACGPGSFKPSVGPAPCTPCPDPNADAPPASVARTACQCNAGYSGPDGGNCTGCGESSYKNESGPGACSACPPHSTARPAALSPLHCRCLQGYSGPDGGPCTPCAAGTYKTELGPASCAPCPTSRPFAPGGSVTVDACTCALGFEGNGTVCSPCAAGTYKDYSGPGNCTACPVPSGNGTNRSEAVSSPPGSASLAACSCVPGSTRGPAGCQPCPPGTFKSTVGPGNCTACPALSEAPPGSTSQSACTCNAGYQRGRSGGCVGCAAGTFKLTQGDEACSQCPPDTYKDTLGPGGCTPCAVDGSRVSATGSVSFENCTCNAGHDGDILDNCLPCTSGTYKDFLGPAACALCPDPHAVTPPASTHVLSCRCPPGFSGPDAGSCSPCPPGAFKPAPGNASCQACPPGTPAAPEASESVGACTCGAGFQLNSSGACGACGAGTYKTALGTQRCTPCPEDTFKSGPGPGQCTPCSADGALGSPQGSASFMDCVCNLGYQGGPTGCTPCPAGTYKDATGAQPCSECPWLHTGVSSRPGSADLSECQCMAGLRRNGSEGCAPCSAGSFKEGLSEDTCQPCPHNATSPPASPSPLNCTCSPGFQPTDALPLSCDPCPPGTFKLASGPHPCEPCPAGTFKSRGGPGECEGCGNQSWSGAGSVAGTACRCVGGYVGADGGACRACGADTFKEGEGDGVCVGCGAGAEAAPASASPLACRCRPGYLGANASACAPCPPATYKPLPGPAPCLPCPPGSGSGNGTAGRAGCVCEAGQSGPDGGPCTPCAPGSYKNASGSQACDRCGAHAVTGEGSTSAELCVCAAGYQPLAGTCQPCPEGFFKLTDGDEACRPCRRGALKDWQGPGQCSVPYFACAGGAVFGPEMVGEVEEGPGGIADLYAVAAMPGGGEVAFMAGNSVNLWTLADGTTRRVAGLPGVAGSAEGVGDSASFDMPAGGMSALPDGSGLVVADSRNHRIRIVSLPDGATFTLAGSTEGFADGTATEARFSTPVDVAVTGDGGRVVVADRLNGRVRVVAVGSGATSTVESGAEAGAGFLPDAVAVTPDALWVAVADSPAHRLLLLSLAPTPAPPRLLAGTGAAGWRDGPGPYAWFYAPAGLALTPSGLFLLVADRRNDVVRVVDMADGYASTLAGSGETGESGGNATTAAFDNLYSVAVAPDGLSVAVADTSNQRLRLLRLQDPSAECVCNAGFTGTIADGCTPCAEGTFKDTAGDGVCVECPTGRPESRTASHEPPRCTCTPGYTGEYPSDCTMCPADSYKEVSGSEVCSACPAASTSAEGSFASTNCSCNRGFNGDDGGPCLSCPAGTFKNVTGPGECLRCPVNTVSAEASPDGRNCICAPGFTGSDCGPCAEGTFKFVNGSGPCAACPSVRAHSPSGSPAEDNCTCAAGYEGDGVHCTPCAEGSYKNATGPGVCEACPDEFAFSSEGARGREECACDAGFELDTKRRCQPCPPGTFKDWPGFGDCEPCPAGTFKSRGGPGECEGCGNQSWSGAGSVAGTACRCVGGYVGADGGACRACGADTFKEGEGDGVCVGCGAGAEAAPASASPLACRCRPGYLGANASACAPCPPATYKPLPGPAPCLPCPPGSGSGNGTAGRAGCVCEAGQSGPDGGPCAPCAPGSYKNASGSQACDRCESSYALTEPGATGPEACQCTPGFEREGAECAQCAESFFKLFVGDQACALCPPATVKLFAGPGNCSLRYYACPDGAPMLEAGGVHTMAELTENASALALTPDRHSLIVTTGNRLMVLESNGSAALLRGEGTVRAVAGGEAAGYVDGGDGGAVRFSGLGGVAVTGGGAVVVADSGNHAIRLVHLNGSTSTLAGGAGTGYQDGTGTAALFAGPVDVAVTGDGGRVVVADRLNGRVRVVAVGSGATSTVESGAEAGAGFLPDAVAVTPDALWVAVADSPAHRLLLLSLAPTPAPPRLLAGTGAAGWRDGPGPYAWFYAPAGLALTPSGLFLLVADPNSRRLRAVALRDGETQTLAGSGAAGWRDGNRTEATLMRPRGVVVTGDGGAAVVADGHKLRVITIEDISAECVCNAGFTGTIADGCTPCAEGSYKDTVGSGGCAACAAAPGPSFSYAAASARSNCTCLPGAALEGGVCVPCLTGTYKELPGPGPCTPCPDNSLSALSGSAHIGNCSCLPGYSGSQGRCTACGAGGYKNESGPGPCAACPPGATSPPASAALAACQCAPGFELSGEPARCRPCPAGAFKPDAGPAPCQLCVAGSFSEEAAAECTPCPATAPYSPAGSNGSNACSCFQGLELSLAGVCVQCPQGKFKLEPGPQPCQTCEEAAPGSTSLPGATSLLKCTCDVGYFGNDGEACTACPPGSYKEFTGPGQCAPCPFLNTTTPPGSSSLSQCQCEAGTQGLGIGPCQACVPGKYKDFTGTAECAACPPNSLSLSAGAASADDCLCGPGYQGSDGDCGACPVGSYKNLSGPAPCTPCPVPQGFTPPASTHPRACICAAGYQGLTDYDCRPCPPATYKDLPGRGQCTPCPDPRSNSSAASPALAACLCDPGFTGPEGGPCRPCAPGTFKPAPGAQNCTVCVDVFANSSGGSVAATDCQCGPGYAGADGGNCSACPEGSYKPEGGDRPCVTCPAADRRTFSPLASIHQDACVCPPGWTSRQTVTPGVNGSADTVSVSARCFECPAGAFKDTPGDARCQPCQNNSMSAPDSPARADCHCNLGFTAGPNHTCVRCGEGSYKNFTGPAPCLPCPATANFSAAGSVSEGNCSCEAGSEETGPEQCTLCPARTFKTDRGPGPCTPCPQASFSPAGSKSHRACVCDVGFTGDDCLSCTPGSYKPAPGPHPCTPCPAGFQFSPPGSTAPANCTCGAGYEGNGSSACTACAAGTDKVLTGYGQCAACPSGAFKLEAGPDTCALCAVGAYKPEEGGGACLPCPNISRFSPPGSTTVLNCTCDFGWSGPAVGNLNSTCEPCPPMTFKNQSGPGQCLPCADPNSFSGPASALCQCNTGYAGPDGRDCFACAEGTFKLPGQPGSLACAPCAAGSYRNTTGPGNCTQCPDPYSWSHPGSTEAQHCVCNQGYTGPDGGPCRPCAVGSYKKESGSGECDTCPSVRAFSPPGSVSALACTCPPGHTLPHLNTSNCSACPPASYKPAPGTGPCTACPLSSDSPAGSGLLGNCTCNAGWTGPDGGNCSACPPRSYKLLRGDGPCTPCTNHSYAPANSTSILFCRCVAGFTGDTVSGGPCLPCPAASYKNHTSNSPCTPCPPEADYALPGSTSRQNCTCNVGFSLNASGLACEACAAGSFKSSLGLHNCTACPDPAHRSPEGSARQDNCSCSFGFVGYDGVNCSQCPPGSFKLGANPGECVLCAAGTYQEQAGQEGCVTCPDLNHTSAPGSSRLLDCLCSPGFSGVPGLNCSACPAHTFKSGFGNQPCQPCPHPAHRAPPASASLLNCSCAPGYSGPDGGNCSACPAGSYKSAEGASPCVPCTNFSYSPPNSSAIAKCECIEGYSGETVLGDPCLPCPETTYKDFVGHGPCTLCPPEADYALPGSTSRQNCTCNVGFSHDSSGRCAPCPRGTFKPSRGFDNCTACPDPDSSSPIASPDASLCACNSGFVGDNGAACTVCPRGTFKLGIDPGQCALCAVGSYQSWAGASGCAVCPDVAHTTLTEGSVSLAACLCLPGFQGPPGGNCSACPTGSYKNSTGTAPCTPCVAAYGYSEPASTSAQNCTCARGFGEEGAAGCVPCAEGFYKASVGRENCTVCPDPYSSSPAASPALASCVCNAGYSGPDGGPCTPCAVGAYKGASGSQACDTCPPFSRSPPASTSVEGCLCNAGYTGVGDNCTACQIGTYKNVTGSSLCVDCPILHRGYSDPGAVNASLCLCERGYTPHPDPDSDQCVECAPGSFKFFEGMTPCLACPAHSTSPARSYFPWDCQCDPGFSGQLEPGEENDFIATLRTCTPCAEGTYKNVSGPLPCAACPLSAVSSPPASPLQANCTCDIGYEETAPLRCRPCLSGTFKLDSGPGPCSQCPPHSFSPPGSTSGLNCTCDVGYEGPGCVPCEAGSYKNETGTGLCRPCPARRNASAPASPSPDNCTCGPGFTGTPSAGCSPCPGGTFKFTVGFDECTPCPDPNAHAPPRSTDPSRCQCNDGYSGPDGGNCSACPAGFFKNESGPAPCRPCPSGTFKPLAGPGQCTVCPLGNAHSAEGSADITACNCSVGYEGLVGGSCTPCAAGEEKLGAGLGVCEACGAGSEKVAGGGEACTLCEEGYFKSTAGPGQCTPCPNATGWSPAGSTDSLNCTCSAGWGGGATEPCYPCPAGSFKSAAGPGECVPCSGSLSFSLPGSASPDDCRCIAGYVRNGSGTECQPCPAGTFKETLGDSGCEPCPPGSYKNFFGPGQCVLCPAAFNFSLRGAVTVDNCTCERGYGGEGGACAACEAGSYKEGGGREGCTACPHPHTLSARASTHPHNCTCNAGYQGAPGQPCTFCAVGTFKLSWGPGQCEACADGTLPANAEWVSGGAGLAVASVACGWECAPGFFHQDPSGLAASSQPNACRPCPTRPTRNPCGYGQYYAVTCATGEAPGCRNCTNLNGPGSYLFPNPAWTSAECPYACPYRYYATRAVMEPLIWYPECVECPPPGDSSCPLTRCGQGPCGLGAGHTANTDCTL